MPTGTTVGHHLNRGLGLALIATLLACSSNPTTDTTTHTVLVTGSLEIPATYDVDLDTGTVPTIDLIATGDLWNESVSDNEDILNATNSTQFKAMGTTEPGYAGCAAASYGTAGFPLIGATLGTWFCVRTTLQHYAEVQLTKTATTGDHNIEIAYTTWN